LRREFRDIALCGLILATLSGCKDKICPAFQSYYVLDDRQRELMFSPFGEDTLPKPDYEVKKSSFGVVSQSPVLPYLQKLEEFKLVERELLFARESALDSVGSADELIDIREELGQDSATAALETDEEVAVDDRDDYRVPENKNVEQETYDRLFGEYLKAAEEERRPKEKKKKEKPPEDLEPPTPVQNDEVDVARADDQTTDPEPKKKKGFLGGFGKKKKQKKSKAGDDEEP